MRLQNPISTLRTLLADTYILAAISVPNSSIHRIDGYVLVNDGTYGGSIRLNGTVSVDADGVASLIAASTTDKIFLASTPAYDAGIDVTDASGDTPAMILIQVISIGGPVDWRMVAEMDSCVYAGLEPIEHILFALALDQPGGAGTALVATWSPLITDNPGLTVEILGPNDFDLIAESGVADLQDGTYVSAITPAAGDEYRVRLGSTGYTTVTSETYVGLADPTLLDTLVIMQSGAGANINITWNEVASVGSVLFQMSDDDFATILDSNSVASSDEAYQFDVIPSATDVIKVRASAGGYTTVISSPYTVI